MKKRIPESWLSAYLDGELDADRDALVARLVARRPEIAKRLDELRRVKLAVASLPKAKLAGDNRRLLWKAVLEHPELREVRKTALSASLDNELTPTQAALLERTATDADLAYAAKLAEVRDALRELPQYVAPKTAIEGAMAQIRFDAMRSLDAAAELRDLPMEAAPPGLVAEVVDDLKPVAAAGGYRVLAFRREGWATGLAAALIAGLCLFEYASPLPGPVGVGLVATVPAPPPASRALDAPKTLARPLAPAPAVAQAAPAKAPSINEPFVDSELLADVKPVAGKTSPPELPVSLLNVARPGARFDLPGTRFTFLCLDVKRMADRVRFVYLKHRTAGGNLEMRDEENGTIVSVEMTATPAQLASVLADLKSAEEADTERLIAEVKVSLPTNAPPSNDSLRLRQETGLANIRPPASDPTSPKPSPNDDAKVASGSVKESPPEAEHLAADAPRQYVLIFRRQSAMGPADAKKG